MKKNWRRQGICKGKSVFTVPDQIRELTGKECLLCLGKAAGMTAVFSYVFYRSFFGALSFPVLATFCLWQGGQEKQQKRLLQLSGQFMDTILSVTGSLQTGYSIENAFLEAEKEIAALYGTDSQMAEELARIRQGLANRIPLEQQLSEFGARCQVEEIRDFTEVFAVLKRSGGNLREMIRRTVELTRQRLEVEQDIAQMLSSRRFEMKIMSFIPFLMYGYVQLTSPGFFDVLYHNPAGISVMTACLMVYLAACALSWRMMEITI